MNILVTGGAGFIGSNFILDWLAQNDGRIVNIDKLTYAGNLQNLASVEGKSNYRFIQGDICDYDLMLEVLNTHKINAVVNFAAESHVDRSIEDPEGFIQTNVVGTFRLLEAARTYWNGPENTRRDAFRCLHVSTDEVYNVGGATEKTNLEVVKTLCRLLDELHPRGDGRLYQEQIQFVQDRIGHDRRYALNADKIERELGWRPAESFSSGIRKTIIWYLENRDWVENVTSGNYREWIKRQYT